MLVGRSDERHGADALISFSAQADLVCRPVPPDVPTTIAHLAQRAGALPKTRRLPVLEVIGRGARLTLRCLYPEPGAARVEDQLVGLPLAPEVHCRENLYVEEVGEVLL